MYPATVVLFVLAALRFEELAVLVPHLLVFAVLLALAVIDMDTLRLPDRLNLPAIACSLAAIVAISFVEGIPEGIVGALLGAGIYFGVLLVAHLIHPAGMGFGDVKLALLMGLYLGWPTPGGLSALVVVVWAMLIGFGLGSVIGILLWLFRRRSAPYPFGPFLALGAVAVMLLAPDLLPASTAADLLF